MFLKGLKADLNVCNGSKADIRPKENAVLQAASCDSTAADLRSREPPDLFFLSQPRRRRRSGEWTSERAVTFIVTLAAARSVTLATRAADMSRKSAYALKARDPAIASAWATAVNAAGRGKAPSSWKGDKVEEVDEPPIPSSHGDTSPSRSGRERAFADLLATLRQATPLADLPPAQ